MNILDLLLGDDPRVARLESAIDEVTRERDALRRQLQNIRIAHEPLQHAIYPPQVGDK